MANSSTSANRLPVAIAALTAPTAALGHVIPGVPGAGWLIVGGLTLAVVGWSVTRCSRERVAVVDPVLSIAPVTAGHGEGPARAIEATTRKRALALAIATPGDINAQ